MFILKQENNIQLRYFPQESHPYEITRLDNKGFPIYGDCYINPFEARAAYNKAISDDN